MGLFVDVVLIVTGSALVLVGLWDMFHSLLHPRGRGTLSNTLQKIVWTLSRKTGHRFGSSAGPAGMVVVTLVWVVLQVVGWALIYLPRIPEGFTYGSGVDPDRYPDVLQAISVSAVILATLGFGDVVPTDLALRLLAPLQALTGFALLTGALSWFTQAFPPLSRRRALALDIDGLRDAKYLDTIGALDPQTVSRDLTVISSDVSKAVVDLVQHSESYFFLEVDPRTSLASQLPYLGDVCEAAQLGTNADVKASAGRLDSALKALVEELRDQFLDTDGSRAEVFRAYARDHGGSGDESR